MYTNVFGVSSDFFFFEREERSQDQQQQQQKTTDLNDYLNWIMSINKINTYIQHSLKSILLFMH